MKFSFSLPSKSSLSQSASRPDPNVTFVQSAFAEESGTAVVGSPDEGPRFITVFDPSEPGHDPSRLVIRPLENTWRADKRAHQSAPLFAIDPAAEPSHAVQFAVEPMSVDEDGGTAMSYGINLRPRAIISDRDEVKPGNEGLSPLSDDEIFRAQLAALPDHRGTAEYEEMPVGEFGRAVLRGYGWREGQGVGRRWSCREDVPIVEPKRCIRGQGLGFKPRRDKGSKPGV